MAGSDHHTAKPMSPRPRPARQGGIALMLVLWVLTLLTVMAVGLTAAQRTQTALTHNHVSAARFRALADAALGYTALDFMTRSTTAQDETQEDTESTWLPNGAGRGWRFAGAKLSIAVFNETSRVNLNLAQPDLLSKLLTVLGLEQDEADSLAAAIVDWRDEDDLALLNGAEDEDYEQAGYPIGAKDAPYESVEELRQVLGMTASVYERLEPEVTVDGESSSPVERFASPAVLAAIRGISMEEAVEEVAIRDDSTVPGATTARSTDRGGPLYRVQVTLQEEGRSGRRMEALVKLNTNQQPPYLVLWKRYGLSLQDPVYGEIDEDQIE